MPAQKKPAKIKRASFKSLSFILITSFLSLILGILLFTNTTQLFLNYQAQESMSFQSQIMEAHLASHEIEQFIKRKTEALDTVVKTVDLFKLSEKERKIMLDKTLSLRDHYRQIVLFDASSNMLSISSRLSEYEQDDLEQKFKSQAVSEERKRQAWISDVYIEEVTSEPMVMISVPVFDVFDGFEGNLVAEINLKFLWDLIAEMQKEAKGAIYVIDRDGHLLAISDIGRVLKGEDISEVSLVKDFISKGKGLSTESPVRRGLGVNGTYVVSAIEPLDNVPWAIVSEIPFFEGYINVFRGIIVSLLITLLGVVIAVTVSIFLSRRIVNPIKNLRDVALKIGDGDLNIKAPIKGNNEISQLGDTFNQMVLKIKGKIKEISEEEARLTASIQGLSLGFAMTDVNRNILFSNPAIKKILNLKEQFSFKDIEESFDGEFDVARYCKQSIDEKKIINVKELKYKNRFLRVIIWPILIKEEQEKALGSVILIEDITEAKLLERSRDEFFSIASHELRTPLTAIRGNTSLIRSIYMDQLKDKDLKEMIEDIHESSTRLISIVNDFLDTSRLELGKMQFKYASINLLELIETVVKEFATTGSINNLYLHFDKPNEILPLVHADIDRLKQVLINLIGNSFKFTKKGGVTISCQKEGTGQVKILVVDTGMGISSEGQKLLFKKFQQAGDSIYTRDVIHGTGLGLYISKMMIEAMGGKITLEKSEVGKGTTFSILVPVAKAIKAPFSDIKTSEAKK